MNITYQVIDFEHGKAELEISECSPTEAYCDASISMAEHDPFSAACLRTRVTRIHSHRMPSKEEAVNSTLTELSLWNMGRRKTK